MADRGGQLGFTLVELLVSLVIFGFVMALSFDALRFSGAAWDTVSTNATALDEETTALLFLRTRFEDMSNPVDVPPDTRDAVQWWLEGDRSEVTFVAPWYRGASPAGLYRFRIWLERRGGTGALVIRWTPFLPGASDAVVDAFSGERVLLERVAAVSLRYFGSVEPEASPDWSQRWRSPSRAPSLVEFEITSEETGQTWTRLVVATGH